MNKSLSLGNKFPTKVKYVTVKLTIKDKDGDSEDYSNYRPISNTSFIAKMLEKAALLQIDNHIKVNNLHAKNQSGYKKTLFL